MNINGPVERTSGVIKINKYLTDLIYRSDKDNTSVNDDLVDKSFDKREIDEAIKKSNEVLEKEASRFKFEVHERTGRILVKLVNNETEEIIKEIPPEKMLDIVGNIWDLVGILVDERG